VIGRRAIHPAGPGGDHVPAAGRRWHERVPAGPVASDAAVFETELARCLDPRQLGRCSCAPPRPERGRALRIVRRSRSAMKRTVDALAVEARCHAGADEPRDRNELRCARFAARAAGAGKLTWRERRPATSHDRMGRWRGSGAPQRGPWVFPSSALHITAVAACRRAVRARGTAERPPAPSLCGQIVPVDAARAGSEAAFLKLVRFASTRDWSVRERPQPVTCSTSRARGFGSTARVRSRYPDHAGRRADGLATAWESWDGRGRPPWRPATGRPPLQPPAGSASRSPPRSASTING